MSYWIHVVGADEEICHTGIVRQEGGTYCLNGDSSASLNVTYNYASKFNFKALDNMPVGEAVDMLTTGIDKLGDEVCNDYWQPADGNVKRCLRILRAFAYAAIEQNIKGAHFIVH